VNGDPCQAAVNRQQSGTPIPGSYSCSARLSRSHWLWLAVACLLLSFIAPARCATAGALFQQGTKAYTDGDYAAAAAAFQRAAAVQPASGTLQNLGNSEWQHGRTGWAILAWERALWVDPFNGHARSNLRFARRAAQLESPELAWYEVVSSWLPVNCWGWVAGISLWLAVGLGLLPGLLHWPKVAWQQAAAAFVLVVFLLSLPALVGVETRSRIGFVLQKDTPLRLTPTADAQYITRLAAGESARLEHTHGRFCLIRTNRTQGWVEREQLGLICQLNGDSGLQLKPSGAGAP
jgi:hypothetical protein